MSTMQSMHAAMPEIFRDHANNIRALKMLDGILLGQGHIIMCDSLAIDPILAPADGGKFELIRAYPCAISNAPRFDEATAEKIAAAIVNGRGTRGRAVHVRDALLNAIAEHYQLEKKLAQMEKVPL